MNTLLSKSRSEFLCLRPLQVSMELIFTTLIDLVSSQHFLSNIFELHDKIIAANLNWNSVFFFFFLSTCLVTNSHSLNPSRECTKLKSELVMYCTCPLPIRLLTVEFLTELVHVMTSTIRPKFWSFHVRPVRSNY